MEDLNPPTQNQSPNEPLQVVLLIGLQASGKSTFGQRFFPTHQWISKDRLRNNKRPQRRQMRLLHQALQAHQSCLIDNTNPTPQDRQPIIALAQEHDAEVIGYFFDTELKACMARNESRTGKDKVPPVGFYTTIKQLTPPTWSEGFDQLYKVTLIPQDMDFHITPWDEPTTTHPPNDPPDKQ